MKQLLWLALCGSLLGGCQKKATDCNLTSNLCSCDRTQASTNPDCRDYDSISKESAQSSCTSDGGTFSTSALCTTSNRAGTCKYTNGVQITYQRYYQNNISSAAAGAVVCGYYKANCFVLSGNALCDATYTSDI